MKAKPKKKKRDGNIKAEVIELADGRYRLDVSLTADRAAVMKCYKALHDGVIDAEAKDVKK